MLDTLPRIRSTVFRAKPSQGARLTHPSWHASLEATPPGETAAIRNAGDFWSRLGL